MEPSEWYLMEISQDRYRWRTWRKVLFSLSHFEQPERDKTSTRQRESRQSSNVEDQVALERHYEVYGRRHGESQRSRRFTASRIAMESEGYSSSLRADISNKLPHAASVEDIRIILLVGLGNLFFKTHTQQKYGREV